ncbi:MAG: tetratricopeptide repeat protein [Bacteroidota bacterium]
MKHLFFVWLLGVLMNCCLDSFAKNDSLLVMASGAVLDKAHFKQELAEARRLSKKHPQQAKKIALRTLEEAESQGAFYPAQQACNILGRLARFEGDFSQAINYHQQALEYQQKITGSEVSASTYLSLGIVYKKMGQYDLAITYYECAKEAYHEKELKRGYVQALNNLGNVYLTKGLLEKARQYQLKALEIRQQKKDSVGLGASYNNLGRIYEEGRDYERALENYLLALDLHTKHRGIRDQANTYFNVGDTYMKLQQDSLAMVYLQKSIELTQQSDYAILYPFIHTTLGELHLKKGDFQQAEHYLLLARDSSKSLRLFKTEILSLVALGELRNKQGDFKAAVESLQEALPKVENVKGTIWLPRLWKNLAEAYSGLGQFELAYGALANKQQMQDSLNGHTYLMDPSFVSQKEDSMRSLESMIVDTKHKVEKLQEERAEFLRIYVPLGAFGLLVLLLLTVFIRYREYKRLSIATEKRKKEIEAKNKRLSYLNTELERIAFMSAHDLKQPLRAIGSLASLVSYRYRNILEEEGKAHLDQIQSSVRHAYNLLSDLNTFVGLSQQQVVGTSIKVPSVITEIWQRYAPLTAKLEMGPMPAISGTPFLFHMMMEQLIKNAVQHGPENNLVLQIESMESEDGSTLLRLQDNGTGISESQLEQIFLPYRRLGTQHEASRSTGMGLSIARKIARLHEGCIWAENDAEGKTSFYVKVT